MLKIHRSILFVIFSWIGFASLAQEALNISLEYQWKDTTLIGSFFYDNTYNEIWGYSSNDKEYAIIGTTAGTHIFDVTVPEDAEEIHFVEGGFTGGNVVHRDFHDYDDYLYIVCDEGSSSTLQIVDLSDLPNSIDVVYDSNELFTRSHNIFIDSLNQVMYVCGGNTQLNLYSLEDPIAPTLLIDCDEEVENWTTQIGYIHDIYVEEGIAYCNAGTNGLFIVDFNEPSTPVVLGSLTEYEESGYNHSGWLHEDGEIYALADETHGTRIKLLDVSDPSDIEIVSFIGSEITSNSIVHNLIFEGDYLHVSYYYDGYYIFDCSDPENPETVAFYDTSTELNLGSYKGAWGVYPFLPNGTVLVSDMQEGLFVFQPDPNIVSIENMIIEESVSLFPNPVLQDDFINLSGLNANESYTYDILDGVGRKVQSGRIENRAKSKIILRGLNQGTYFLNLQSNNQPVVIKFIKQ